MDSNFDCSGYATRNDLLCGDGRTIRRNAFKDNDGCTVPLVWNHDHANPEAVLGHALLENREDGVYAYCKFNDTEQGQNAKKLVQHGDVRSFSIYANKLKQIGRDVVHGTIRELSLVLAGANPGATIDFVMAHGDEGDAGFYANYDENALVLYHSEKDEKGEEVVAEETKKPEEKKDSDETLGDVFETLNEKQKKAVYSIVAQVMKDKSEDEVKHSDDEASEEAEVEAEEAEVVEESEEAETNEEAEAAEEAVTEESEESEEVIEHSDDDGETVRDVLDTLNEKQAKVVYALIGEFLKDSETEIKHADEDIEGGNDNMKTNVFENKEVQTEVLSHSEMTAILEDAKRCGSLREAVIQHGITDIELLFPDAQALNNEPGFIKRNDDWVAKVLAGVHHSPFARVKTVFADITADEARAKGYTKGNLKLEEVIKLLKRVTGPTTVYKKQKLDRDDIIDMDFNVVPWLKGELRMMLNEELARAYLIGDGRSELSEDKINEECIRPIWKMEDLFTIKAKIEVPAAATAEERAKAFIKACVKTRKDYKGSGNPSMFMPEDILTDCLLIEDKNGRVIYETEDKLRARLRVKEIIPVPVMENQTRTVDGAVHTLAGLYVNLADYNVGTNKGGEINMFDDFDIDYNTYKYLMETRCSGTLTKPFSAVALEFVEAATV